MLAPDEKKDGAPVSKTSSRPASSSARAADRLAQAHLRTARARPSAFQPKQRAHDAGSSGICSALAEYAMAIPIIWTVCG
jgi:hypothetical protein